MVFSPQPSESSDGGSSRLPFRLGGLSDRASRRKALPTKLTLQLRAITSLLDVTLMAIVAVSIIFQGVSTRSAAIYHLRRLPNILASTNFSSSFSCTATVDQQLLMRMDRGKQEQKGRFKCRLSSVLYSARRCHPMDGPIVYVVG
jgi:hypothetical protein